MESPIQIESKSSFVLTFLIIPVEYLVFFKHTFSEQFSRASRLRRITKLLKVVNKVDKCTRVICSK